MGVFFASYFPAFLSKVLNYKYLIKFFLNRRGAFIDFNQFSMPNSYFADRVHINFNGASFLTQKRLDARIE